MNYHCNPDTPPPDLPPNRFVFGRLSIVWFLLGRVPAFRLVVGGIGSYTYCNSLMNFTHLASACCLCIVLHGSASAQAANDSSPAVAFNEIGRNVLQLADRKITYVRVRPPVLPPVPANSIIASTPTSSLEAQVPCEDRPLKPSVNLAIGATVYIGPNQSAITELRWNDDSGGIHIAWSSADFRYLANFSSFESDTAVYHWFLMASILPVVSLADVPVPEGVVFDATHVEYYVCAEAKIEGNKQEQILTGLDYLHAFYQLNYTSLKAAYNELQDRIREDERAAALNPPKPQNSTIHFWKLPKSSHL